MIDTDKYGNITPERWTVDEEDPCRVMDVQECTIARTDFIDIEEEREWQLANAQLIADAPDLLIEVKQLRKDLKTMTHIRDEINRCLKDDDEDGPFDVMLKIESILHKNRWIEYA
jgi:hypothetical protein